MTGQPATKPTPDTHPASPRLSWIPACLSAAVCLLLACGFALPTAHAQPAAKVLADGQSEPSYMVLATDVSGSMNLNDIVVRDASGNRRAFRDDAQLTFLQLLPFLKNNNHIGVFHFTQDVNARIPKDADGPAKLVPWNSTTLPGDLRSQINSVNVKSGRTRISNAMDFSLKSIEMTRGTRGGEGLIILLTDGDPDSSTAEREASIRVANALSRAQVRVHVVLINKASYRPGREPGALSSKDRRAVENMEQIAQITGGQVHRITPVNDLLAIVLKILGEVGIQKSDFKVSRYHRSAVMIGPPVNRVVIEPSDKGNTPRTVLLDNGVDQATGINRTVVPLARWNINILRRPGDEKQRTAAWTGKWTPITTDGKPYSGRVYLIPDFLLSAVASASGRWHAYEAGDVSASLAERPRERIEASDGKTKWSSDRLIVHARISYESGGATQLLTKGKWDSTRRQFDFDPLHLDRPGRYRLSVIASDRVGDTPVVLGRREQWVTVAPSRASVIVRKEGADGVLQQVPTPSNFEAQSAVKGGDRITVEVRGPKSLKMQGEVVFDGLTPARWELKAAGDGKLMSEPVALPEKELQLKGRAVVTMGPEASRTEAVFPIELTFAPAPPRLAVIHTEPRKELWKGEYHEQDVMIEIAPVFAPAQQAVIGALPMNLPEAVLRVFEPKSKRPTLMAAKATLVGKPVVTGSKNRTVQARYRIVAAAPLPDAERCEVDPGVIALGLRAKPKSYGVIDPIAQKRLVWRIAPQGAGPGSGLSELLYRNVPVVLEASGPKDAIKKMVFAIDRPSGNEAKRFTLEKFDETGKSRLTQRIDEDIDQGGIYNVRLLASYLPKGADKPIDLRLAGGQFKADDLWVQVKQMQVGNTSGEDIPGRAYERTRIPLQVHFTGYDPERHKQLIEQFKKSCKLTASPLNDKFEASSADILWTTVKPPAKADGRLGVYQFEGYASYAPLRTGVQDLTFSCELIDNQGRVHRFESAARLNVEQPEVHLEVRTEEGTEDAPARFDSTRWAEGDLEFEAEAWRFARPIQVKVGRRASASGEWPLELRVLRREGDKNEAVAIERFSLAHAGAKHDYSYTPNRPGVYLLELRTQGLSTAKSTAHVMQTPVLVNFNPVAIATMLAPSGRLTEGTQQWPFRYRVEVQPDWAVHPDALAFEFRMHGQDVWHAGLTREVVDSDGKRWLELTNPQYLPPMTDIKSGRADFRLTINKGEVSLNWQSKQITVEPARLSTLGFASGEAVPGEVSLAGGVKLKPMLARVPGLNRWQLKDLTAYVVAEPGADMKAEASGAPSAQFLASLKRLADSSAKNVTAFTANNEVELANKSLLPEDEVGFFTWRGETKRPFAFLVAANYVEEFVDAAGETQTREISEWSGVKQVMVVTPAYKGGFWVIGTYTVLSISGMLAVLLVLGALVALLRKAVPKPEDLAVSLESTAGTVEIQTSQRSGRTATFQSTSLAEEVQWQQEYRRSSAKAKPMPRFLLLLGALLRRILVPERRAWAVIRPKLDRAENVQVALACITTSLSSKEGKFWFSEDEGAELPVNGQAQMLSMVLGFEQAGQKRNIPLKAYMRR